MLHNMRLRAEPYMKISSGKKTVELRLYDEKRRRIAVGDEICFTLDRDESQRVIAEVTALYVYSSFEELYRDIPPEKMGYEDGEMAHPSDMLEYYSHEEQSKCGVIAIEIRVL